MAPRKVYVVGVGMTAFQKPRGLVDYPELGLEAATKALLDANLNYDDVQQAYVGYSAGDSCCGQRALYQLGMTGIPITNVNNNCSTGSTAIFLARQAVQYGVVECALALGFEVMAPGSLSSPFKNSTPPLDKTFNIVRDTRGGKGPPASQIFGNGGQEYCEKYGATIKHIAQTAKNHHHSVNNPYSQFRNDMTVEEVLSDKPISNLLSRAMCCPTSDGGAAAVIVSEDFVHKHGLESQAIEILHQAVATDDPALYDQSSIGLTGDNMTRRAAKEAFTATGLTPADMRIIELHDCFAPNELLVYEGLGLCKKGQAHKIVERGDNTYGGKWIINPSGGLLSKGHPLGATGIGMYFYLVTQLRGIAGPMQVKDAGPQAGKKGTYALAHNLGLGGSCSVSILARPDFFKASASDDGVKRVGYNFGYECRKITKACVDKVKSRKAFSEFAFKPEPMPRAAPNSTSAIAKL